MGNKLFEQHERDRKAAENKTADYSRSLAETGSKVSSDKGGKTEKLRDAHTKRSK